MIDVPHWTEPAKYITDGPPEYDKHMKAIGLDYDSGDLLSSKDGAKWYPSLGYTHKYFDTVNIAFEAVNELTEDEEWDELCAIAFVEIDGKRY